MTNFEQIDIHEVNRLRVESDVVLVDIRDEQAYETAHVPQAISVNDKNMREFLQNTDKKKKIVCYCYHGISSQSAAEYFAQQGFKQVYSMKGGFEEWRTAYPTS